MKKLIIGIVMMLLTTGCAVGPTGGYGYGHGYGWSGPRWVPGYIRHICENRSTGRVCYDTWEPAHYQ